MSVRNLHWYNSNATRGYPLADQALGVSTDGVALPSQILADLNLRYPRSLGKYVFLASVTVTPTLVSFTIQVTSDPDDATKYAPVAAFVALREDVEEHRQYALQSQYPGVAGWVVFGAGVDEPYAGRFSLAAGLLAPRAARPYRELPVTSLGLLYDATPLTGIVDLKGEQPIEVSKAEREVDGVLRDVVVFRLVQPTAAADLQTTQQSVFEKFAGPCGKRPESGNCGDNKPIEFVNAVPPNCEGKIFIQFKGCARIARVSDECGIVLDCGLGLIDACAGKHLPAADGKLANEYDDACLTSESVPAYVSESVPANYTNTGLSESAPNPDAFPYSEGFDSSPAGWRVASGAFTAAGGLYTTQNTGRSVALWNVSDAARVGHKYTIEVRLRPGGTRRNGGIALNYRPAPDFSGRSVYHVVEIDYDTQQFRVAWFNGTQLLATSAFAQLTNLALDRWYRIEATTSMVGDLVQIAATLTALAGPALTASATLQTSQYMPDTGQVGLHADRAVTDFGYLQVEEV